MKLKKGQLILFVFTLSIIISILLISSQSPIGSIPGGKYLGNVSEETGLPESFDKFRAAAGNLSDEELRKQYLEMEFKKIILQNPIVKSIDSWCTANTLLFRIIFGSNYSLTLTFLFIVVLWFVFFLKLPDIIKEGFNVNIIVSFLLAIPLTIIIANLQIFWLISNIFVKIILLNENTWIRSLLFLFVIIIIIFIYYLEDSTSKYLREQKKKKKEENTELNKKELDEYTKGIRKYSK